MEKNTKRKISAVLIFLTSFIYFGLAYKGYKRQGTPLTGYDKITSIIEDKGTDYRYGKNRSQCFYIRLRGSDKKLGVYRMSRAYDDLLDQFQIGDTVTAYFRDNHNTSENINIDLVQVEKGKQILLNQEEYKEKESSLVYIGLTFGLFSVVMSYWQYKRTVQPRLI